MTFVLTERSFKIKILLSKYKISFLLPAGQAAVPYNKPVEVPLPDKEILTRLVRMRTRLLREGKSLLPAADHFKEGEKIAPGIKKVFYFYRYIRY